MQLMFTVHVLVFSHGSCIQPGKLPGPQFWLPKFLSAQQLYCPLFNLFSYVYQEDLKDGAMHVPILKSLCPLFLPELQHPYHLIDATFYISMMNRSIGQLTHRLLTPMTAFPKGKKVILCRWIFNLCRFSCTLSLKILIEKELETIKKWAIQLLCSQLVFLVCLKIFLTILCDLFPACPCPLITNTLPQNPPVERNLEASRTREPTWRHNKRHY